MQTPYERYLKIVAWARKRYSRNGQLIISIGGNPSPYSFIENLAAVKLLGAMNHW